MQKEIESQPAAAEKDGRITAPLPGSPARLHSRDLFQDGREVEILHGNRVYRLRLTQQNKLILTA